MAKQSGDKLTENNIGRLYERSPLADSHVLHMYLADAKDLKLIRQPKTPSQQRRILFRSARHCIRSCTYAYDHTIDAPALSAFHMASELHNQEQIDVIFQKISIWNVIHLEIEDLRLGGLIASKLKSTGSKARTLGKKIRVDDEYPLLAAQALRLGRAIISAKPGKYTDINKVLANIETKATLDIIDVRRFDRR